MGYSTSEATLARIITELRRLEPGKQIMWTTEPGKAGRFAYKLREGLYIAMLYKHKYPRLAEAAGRFQIKVTAHNKVLAIRLGDDLEKLESESGEPLTGPARPPKEEPGPDFIDTLVQVAAPKAPEPPVEMVPPSETVSALEPITGPQTEFSVIEQCRKRLEDGSPGPFHFPQAGLTDRQLERVYRWAKLKQPELMLMWSFPSLTVAPEDPDVSEWQWRPPGED